MNFFARILSSKKIKLELLKIQENNKYLEVKMAKQFEEIQKLNRDVEELTTKINLLGGQNRNVIEFLTNQVNVSQEKYDGKVSSNIIENCCDFDSVSKKLIKEEQSEKENRILFSLGIQQ